MTTKTDDFLDRLQEHGGRLTLTPGAMPDYYGGLADAARARARNACSPQTPPSTALDTQVGGDHYKDQKIQPVEYIHANGLGFFEGNVIKYVTRWRKKGGLPDLEKARHYIDLLIELERRSAAEKPVSK